MRKDLGERVKSKGENVRISFILTKDEACEVRKEIGDSELVVVDRENGEVVCVAYHEPTDIVGNRLYVMEERHFKKSRLSKQPPANKVLQQFGYVRINGGFRWSESNLRKSP